MIYSGKDGVFLVNGTEVSCRTVSVKFTNNVQNTNRFQSRGKNTNVKGFDKCTFTAKGPYDTGMNAGMTAGEEYTFTHTVGGAISYAVLCRITSLTISNDADGHPELDIEAESDGNFTAQVL